MLDEILKKLQEETLNNKFDCSNLQQPEDITSQCDYKDEFPNGRNDRKWVACCQSKDDGNNYDELKNFYEEHFSEEERKKYGEKILKAMCKCCNKKGKEKWSWEDYKKCVKDELGKRGLRWE